MDYKPGDIVSIIGQEGIAEVISVRGSDLEIGMGGMKVRIKKSKVQPAIKPEEKNIEKGSGTSVDTKEKLLHFKFELDVRGKAKEEVISELTSWTDDAILLGVEEAKIWHGRGTGVLKETVRSFLKKYKEVRSVGDGEDGRGENVTLVRFVS